MQRTLAMDCSFLRDTANLPAVFGFDVAVNSLLDALLRYGSFERYVLFHPPGWAADRIASLRTELRSDAEFVPTSITEIPAVLGRGEVSSWFQPDTSTELLRYRTAFTSAPLPFSTLIHIAWGPRLVRTQFLWLLLDGFAPCDSFVCTSRAVRDVTRATLDYLGEEMRRYCGAKLEFAGRLDLLPLGLDVDRFRPRPKREARQQVGWPDDAFIMLWFGRFSVVDKADLLPALRMFRALLNANPDRRLLFVLAGSDRRDVPFVPALQAFAEGLGIAEHVRVLDGPSQEIRETLFAAADVFTSPVDNLQETFGITVIEAMACGTPQVVSDWDGYKDTTVHGVTGYRIPTFWANCDGDDEAGSGVGGFGYQGYLFAQTVAVDLREYQRALQRLIDDADLCRAMSAASRQRALDVFAWEKVIGAYEELWMELEGIARRMRTSDLPRPPFLRAELCRRFDAFPTVVLDGNTPIEITTDGVLLATQAEPFPWHSPHERALLDATALCLMLDSVRQQPGTLDELAARFSEADDRRRPAALRALMWGLKHGLLACTAPCRIDQKAGFMVSRATPASI